MFLFLGDWTQRPFHWVREGDSGSVGVFRGTRKLDDSSEGNGHKLVQNFTQYVTQEMKPLGQRIELKAEKGIV